MRGIGSAIRQATTRRPASGIPGSAPGLPGLIRRYGLEGQLSAFGATGTMFQIVTTLANATGRAPWAIYRKRAPREDPLNPRRQILRHAALDLLASPNPFMTGQYLIEAVQQHVELVGEGYLLVVPHQAMDVPGELWPIRPDRMEPVPHPERFLLGWTYHGPEGEQISLDLDQVIPLIQPHPLDPYRGFGAVQAIMVELEVATMSAEWNRSFFRNGARPGAVIEHPRNIKDAELDKFQRQWEQRHHGVRNAHRVAVLEGGATFKEVKYTAEEMQLVESRKLTRDLLREAFGVSKTMLGDTEQVNRASAEAAQVVFARDKKRPRLERWRQAFNHNLLPLYGSIGANYEFDFDAEIPEDEAAQAAERNSKTAGAATLVNAGWDPQDVLLSMGLPAMRWVGPSQAQQQTPTAPTGGQEGAPA